MNFVRPNNYLINFNNSFERMVAAIVSFIVGIIVFIYAWVSWNQAIAYDKLRTAYATGKVVDIQYNFKYFYTKSKNLNSKTKSYTTYVIETGTHDKMKTKGEYVVDPSDNKPYSIESVESSIKEIQVETERHNKITVKADKLAIDPKYINLNNTLMKVEYDPNNIENSAEASEGVPSQDLTQYKILLSIASVLIFASCVYMVYNNKYFYSTQVTQIK